MSQWPHVLMMAPQQMEQTLWAWIMQGFRIKKGEICAMQTIIIDEL